MSRKMGHCLSTFASEIKPITQWKGQSQLPAAGPFTLFSGRFKTYQDAYDQAKENFAQMVKILEYNNKPGSLAKTVRMDISDFEKSIKDSLGHHMYYEKDGYQLTQRIKIDLGIDNVLLPEGQRIAFARRADLAEASGEHDPNSQSSQAKLHWSISDAAIERVNGHFADLRARAQAHDDTTGGFLIVDELGQLELLRGGGLTEAVGILQDGPTALTRHALVVVREALLAHLDGRFNRWGQIELVNPDKPSQSRILATLTESR